MQTEKTTELENANKQLAAVVEAKDKRIKELEEQLEDQSNKLKQLESILELDAMLRKLHEA